MPHLAPGGTCPIRGLPARDSSRAREGKAQTGAAAGTASSTRAATADTAYFDPIEMREISVDLAGDVARAQATVLGETLPLARSGLRGRFARGWGRTMSSSRSTPTSRTWRWSQGSSRRFAAMRARVG